MSPMISDRTLDELRSRCDIVELIGSYVPLKRSGKNFTACCPFHEETKPSFMVNQERQIFKCFGCGKGGNVFHFIMQRERVGFFDSVRMIADRVGYELPAERPQVREGEFKKTDLFDVTAFAVNCFQSFLKDGSAGKAGMDYLLGRGISRETMEELKLGYAPRGSRLMSAAREKGYSEKLLLEAGLLAENQEGKLHDKFHNRVMFPIFNPQGRAIGFSGRALEDYGPKYMNSPETALFNKSRVLYGLNFTRDEMMKAEHGIICEGHVDFVMLYQNGIRNAVAAQGTAFTDDQAKLLRRYAPKVTFAFDSDPAGRKAVIRSLEPLLKAGLEVRVAEIPDGHDPDSFVREKGADEFGKVIDRGRDYFDFQYDVLATENNPNEQQGRLTIASEMLASIKKVPSDIVKDDMLQKLSQRMHITIDTLRNEMRKIRGDSRAFAQKEETGPRKLTAEEELIDFGLRFTSSLKRIMAEVNIEDFQLPHCRKIAGAVFDMASEEGEVTFDKVLHSLQSEEESSILTELMVREAFAENDEEVLCDLIDGVLMSKWSARKDELKSLMDEAGRSGSEEYPLLAKEYSEIHERMMRRKRARFRMR